MADYSDYRYLILEGGLVPKPIPMLENWKMCLLACTQNANGYKHLEMTYFIKPHYTKGWPNEAVLHAKGKPEKTGTIAAFAKRQR